MTFNDSHLEFQTRFCPDFHFIKLYQADACSAVVNNTTIRRSESDPGKLTRPNKHFSLRKGKLNTVSTEIYSVSTNTNIKSLISETLALAALVPPTSPFWNEEIM